MPTIHSTSTFNVEATLNKWLQEGLAALAKPAWLASYSLAFNQPETPIVTPAFSVVHLPDQQDTDWMSKNPGINAAGIIEIGLWVARSATWNAQIKTMQAMVESVAAGDTSITIYDYLTNPASPSPTLYKINIAGVQAVSTPPSPNPDLLHRRLRIGYSWVLRSNS
jgi:hypothetical protein